LAAIGPRATGAVVIRINAADSGDFEADLEVAVREPVTALLLSKVRGSDDVRLIAGRIAYRELAARLPAGHLSLIVTIETARSLIEVGDVLDSSEQIGGVAVGVAEGGDLQRDLGTMWTPDGEAMLFARSHVVAHARARGIRNIIEGPYVRHADDDGLRAEAEKARRLGFTGKAAIHPRQVPIINAAFSPSDEELDYHRRVVAAMEAAIASGAGAATVDGRMVDLAMLELGRAALSGPWARTEGEGS
jgi:citrate lyase subunit beta/citryl-CoA lyase